MSHANFTVLSVEPDRVFVAEDDRGWRSITNDAEWVWARVATQFPGRRLIYRGETGRLDEVSIDANGDAVFSPYRESVPEFDSSTTE
jgi:hypothetical protein